MPKQIKADLDQVVEAIMNAHPFDYGERDCDCDYYLDKAAIRTALEQFVVEDDRFTWLVNHFKKLQKEGEKMTWNQIIQIVELCANEPLPTTPTKGGSNG
jgi:hypothetical protein